MTPTRTALLALAIAALAAAAPLHADDRDSKAASSHGPEGRPPSTIAPPPGEHPSGALVQPGDNGMPSPGDEGSGTRPNAPAPVAPPGEPGVGDQ
jgi:hypothetical protein